jgi:hypothetical protein
LCPAVALQIAGACITCVPRCWREYGAIESWCSGTWRKNGKISLSLRVSSCFSKNFLLRVRKDGVVNVNFKYYTKIKVCKSVHHRTIHINHQPDATIFQFIILTFIYSLTCFGRFPAHHQELDYCNGSLWFYLRIGRPDHEHSTTITTIRR